MWRLLLGRLSVIFSLEGIFLLRDETSKLIEFHILRVRGRRFTVYVLYRLDIVFIFLVLFLSSLVTLFIIEVAI